MRPVHSESSGRPSIFGDKGAPFLQVKGRYLSHEGLMTCFRGLFPALHEYCIVP